MNTVTTDNFYDTVNVSEFKQSFDITGEWDDIKCELKFNPELMQEHQLIQENISLTIYHTKDNQNTPVYVESHYIEPHIISLDNLHTLFCRGKEIANKLNFSSNSIEFCPYCGNIVHEDWGFTKILSLLPSNSKRILSTDEYPEDNICIGMHTFLFLLPKVEIYRHKTDNIFFDEEELYDCDTLQYTIQYFGHSSGFPRKFYTKKTE